MSVEIEIIPESIQLIRMSDEEYFSDKYKDYVSNSGLGMLNPEQDGSLEIYTAGWNSKYSDSFELGSAIHMMILQSGDYYISDITKPTAKLGVFVDNILKLRTKGNITLQAAIDKAKIDSDYYSKSLTDNKLKTAIKKGLPYYLNRLKDNKIEKEKTPIYLSSTLKEKTEICVENVLGNTDIMGKLYPSTLFGEVEVFNEYAVLCEIKVTIHEKEIILKVKSKLDNFTINHETKVITLNDLKSTGKPAKFFMGNYIHEYAEDGTFKKKWLNGSFQKYHYYRQIAMYIWLLNAYCKLNYEGNYKLEANMLLIETIPNYSTRLCPVNGNYVNAGLKEFKELITTLAEWMILTREKTQGLKN